MFPLFETIQVNNGKYCNLDLHQQRVEYSSLKLWGHSGLKLNELLPKIPIDYRSGTVKCKVLYNELESDISFSHYRLPEINSLKLINSDQVDYSLKFSNRDVLKTLFSQRDECDDIIIVKNGLISDTFFCNIVVDTGSKLLTTKHPLLNGTRRQEYINDKTIIVSNLTPKDLADCKGVYLINAMISIEDNVFVPANKIVI